jgi:hypothetical protein
MIRKKLHQWWAWDSDGQWQAATHELDMPLTPQGAAKQSSRNFLTRMCIRCVLEAARRSAEVCG